MRSWQVNKKCGICEHWITSYRLTRAEIAKENLKGKCIRFPDAKDTPAPHSCGGFSLDPHIDVIGLMESKEAYAEISDELRAKNKKLETTLKKRNQQLKAMRQKEL